MIEENPYVTRQEFAEKLGMSIDGIDKNIKKLKKSGIIRRVGAVNGGHWEVINQPEN